ncbi:AIPR family protein [Sphingomonas panacisoli]|uniref:AIPR family protein n=1 Tax=Sphingomonas panacisoli TaxID=1813879 RepID=UPI00164826D1|nr:AIPR family protein [Sphingomonas panacisoli]
MTNTSNDVRGRETRISYQLIRNVTSSEEKENGVQTHIVNIPAVELKKLGTEDNLRTYIPAHSNKRRNAVHRAIARTIETEPSRFINRNSGITIACSKATINDNASLIALVGASIINGAQTQGEILRFLSDLTDEEEEAFGRFSVRAEIIVDPDHSSIVETAIARNTATKVQDISQAGARGHLNDLSEAIRREFGQDIRTSETDTDVLETFQILQFARLLMPIAVSGNPSASEMLRPYKNKAQCLEDFSEWYLNKDADLAAATRYQFVIDIAATAIREYQYWERHPAWNGNYAWGETKKGGRAVRRDKANKVVWVSPGIIFPILKAMSAFVRPNSEGKWILDKPSLFKPDEMVRKAVAQFRAHESNPMDMGRSQSAYEALLTYPETIIEVMRDFADADANT